MRSDFSSRVRVFYYFFFLFMRIARIFRTVIQYETVQRTKRKKKAIRNDIFGKAFFTLFFHDRRGHYDIYTGGDQHCPYMHTYHIHRWYTSSRWR